MQDLLTTQMISTQATGASSRRSPQSEFQARDDSAKNDFMDAIQNAISSEKEKTDSAPKKTEQPKEASQNPSRKENNMEQQSAAASDGSETIVISVDPSFAAVFPVATVSENANVEMEGVPVQNLEQNALMSQTQTIASQVQQETAQSVVTQQTTAADTVGQQTATVVSAKQQQSIPTEQGVQTQNTAASNAPTAQNTAQASTDVKPQFTNAESGQQEGDGASLTSEKGTETVTDGSLAKAQQSNPDTIFVKVGESGMPEEPRQLTAQLGEKIQTNFTNGRQEFDIQLNPQELGKIQIKMSFENGRVTVLVHCSNPETQQLLAANAGQLREVLENNTGLRAEVTTNGQDEEQQSSPEKEKENQAREEQKDRQKEQQLYQSSELERSAFLQKFRLGIMNFQ